MSRFLTNLRVINLEDKSSDGRGTWQLTSSLIYQSDLAQNVIVVPKDFITDFASVPRIPVAFLLCGDTATKASVIHDWLYTAHEFPRATADGVLREAALCTGVPAWRANLLYLGVRLGGQGPWIADGQKQPSNIYIPEGIN